MSRIIDAHVHYLLRPNEEKNLLSGMDAAGVDKALVLALMPLGFMNACLAGNDEVQAVCKRHPKRLAMGAFVDPRRKNAARDLRRLAGDGAKAIKLFPPIGFYPDDDACMPVYEVAADLKLPVLSHTGATNCDYWPPRKRQSLASHWADPIRFDGLARKFPEVTFVLAHMGFPWSLNAWYVAAGNNNVYLDISGGWFWLTALPALYESSGRQVPIDFANKVMWGSDNCLAPVEHIKCSRKLLKSLGCPAKCLPAVFGGTAAKVFEI
jgi:predicted TIM-barrel fold metal-dependent hydrolase